MSRNLSQIAVPGILGLLVLEIWSRTIASAYLGAPIEMEGLVAALAHHHLGIVLTETYALLMLYGAAIALLPLAYIRIAEGIPRHGLALDVVGIVAATASLMLVPGGGIGQGSGSTVWVLMMALVATRWINPSPRFANAISWGICTVAFMLGVLAPLGGLSPFHLSEGLPTALMSAAGWLLYGASSAALMGRRQPRKDPAASAGPRQEPVLNPASGALRHV